MKDEIRKYAEAELDWLLYYSTRDSRILCLDQMTRHGSFSIYNWLKAGYSKKEMSLDQRCAFMIVESHLPISNDIEYSNLTRSEYRRDPINGRYSALEFWLLKEYNDVQWVIDKFSISLGAEIKDNNMNKIAAVDIKYLGIPNICFSLTDKDDKREIDYKKQRIEMGFDDSETWSLRDSIARFIVPRLKRYQEIANDYLVRDEELVNDIDSFLRAMELVSRNKGSCIHTDEERKQITEGIDKFPKIFMSLWW